MKTLHNIHRVAFENPEAFEAGIAHVGGPVHIRPTRGSKLRGKVDVASLQRIGLMAIDADPMTVCKDHAAGFYGLTMTRGAPFGISDERRISTFNRDSAHLLTPDKQFDFSANNGASVLVANFFVDNLQDYACRLNVDTDAFRPPEDYRLSLATPQGASLVRYLTFIWGELNQEGGLLNSELVAKEIEDGLIAALVWSLNNTMSATQPDRLDKTHPGVARAEEYLLAHLCDPISRTELAELAGVSVRTLSRAFFKHHGMGPMEFLRRHRLEAARMRLLQADPGEVRVSDVALQYGFAQPSKFTSAYKAAFDETPSETLRR